MTWIWCSFFLGSNLTNDSVLFQAIAAIRKDSIAVERRVGEKGTCTEDCSILKNLRVSKEKDVLIKEESRDAEVEANLK